jgi:hypothetical protein
VAFGRRIGETKSKLDEPGADDGTTGAGLDSRQKKLVKAGGASMGRVMMRASEQRQQQQHHRGGPSPHKSPPLAPRGGGRRGGGAGDDDADYDAPRGGFHKLAAKARQGPVVVTYVFCNTILLPSFLAIL